VVGDVEGAFFGHGHVAIVQRDGACQIHIDEAAFVLAELLHADVEAIALLERHGRLRAAAELAEARPVPPALAVRAWLLAGDAARSPRRSIRPLRPSPFARSPGPSPAPRFAIARSA